MLHIFKFKNLYICVQTNFKNAKKRIVIASLYLGTGQLEQDLVRNNSTIGNYKYLLDFDLKMPPWI